MRALNRGKYGGYKFVVCSVFCVMGSMLISCSPKNQPKITKPLQDLSTPVSAVKSFMKRAQYANLIREQSLEREQYFIALDSEYYKDFNKFARGSDDIVVDVINELEKTAVLKISYLLYERAMSRESSVVLLKKVATDWKIEEIRDECILCDGTGKVDDYKADYPYPKKICDSCKGKGWRVGYSLPAMRY